jgi:hypothetical protein
LGKLKSPEKKSINKNNLSSPYYQIKEDYNSPGKTFVRISPDKMNP